MMSRRLISECITRLEQTGYQIQVLTYTRQEAISEETCNFVRASAASRGLFQVGNESLAELFARSLGISCRELKAAMRVHASAIPDFLRRCTPGRRRG
jgi:hypothetical protein